MTAEACSRPTTTSKGIRSKASATTEWPDPPTKEPTALRSRPLTPWAPARWHRVRSFLSSSAPCCRIGAARGPFAGKHEGPLACALLHRIYPGPKGFCFSPLSLYDDLELAYVGSAGETRGELHDILHLGDPAELMPLKQGNGVQGADGLYPDESITLLAAFLEKVHALGSSKVETLSFRRSEESARKVNHWVKQQTHD